MGDTRIAGIYPYHISRGVEVGRFSMRGPGFALRLHRGYCIQPSLGMYISVANMVCNLNLGLSEGKANSMAKIPYEKISQDFACVKMSRATNYQPQDLVQI